MTDKQISRIERIKQDIKRLEELSASFRSIGTSSGSDITLVEVEKLLGDKFFGVKQYKELLGVDVTPSPLVGLTKEYLESLCPVKKDGKTRVFESNVALVWVPEMISGKPATVQSLAKLLNDAGERLNKGTVVYKASWGLNNGNNEEVFSKPTSKGHWALVWLDPVPDTMASGMTLEKQDKIFKDFQNTHNKNGIIYDTAEFIPTFLASTLTYLKTGNKIFDGAIKYLVCSEAVSFGGRAVLGRFGSDGLDVGGWDGLSISDMGRAVFRKLLAR